ncbi:MAG: hypothetical protein MRY21_06995 [Simkaniaceae bacterium]|nr:hypothetical protein [Simkaniaceae bacterium]
MDTVKISVPTMGTAQIARPTDPHLTFERLLTTLFGDRVNNIASISVGSSRYELSALAAPALATARTALGRVISAPTKEMFFTLFPLGIHIKTRVPVEMRVEAAFERAMVESSFPETHEFLALINRPLFTQATHDSTTRYIVSAKP